jgi:hypothetical protein
MRRSTAAPAEGTRSDRLGVRLESRTISIGCWYVLLIWEAIDWLIAKLSTRKKKKLSYLV